MILIGRASHLSSEVLFWFRGMLSAKPASLTGRWVELDYPIVAARRRQRPAMSRSSCGSLEADIRGNRLVCGVLAQVAARASAISPSKLAASSKA